MITYNQLNQAQRYQIEILKKAGKENKEIAELIETSAATISRELRRNGGENGYDAEEAHARAEPRLSHKNVIDIWHNIATLTTALLVSEK